MRRAVVALCLMAGAAIAPLGLSPSAAVAQSMARRPNMGPARAAFYQLSPTDRISLHLMLMATGDFNAMVSDDVGGRLYDAIASFQQSQGFVPTGIADPGTMAQLQAKGGVILRSWGMHFVDHPFAQASLFVPGTFGLTSTLTRRGLAFENVSHSMSIDFAFFPVNEASMADIFSRLSTPLPNRRIDLAVIRESFFAVAGGGANYGTYSRYIPVAGGTVGFTATWNTSLLPNANRVAVVMANGLLPSHSQPDVATLAPQPVPPPQQASLEAPKPPPPANVTVTGSAFFVSTEGDLLTNNHVIKGCASATIIGRGSARILAKDAKNDLALLRLDSMPADVIKPATFRGAPMQLGEAVYVLGFPYAGALDNGVNFTNGMVSSVAGMNNDTTNFQMTAAVQPGNSGGPVLDGSGNLLGVTVARMNDIAALEATHTVPQSVNFGIKGDVAASFLRVNGIEPKMSTDAAPLPATQIAASGKAFTVQVMCERVGGVE